MLTGMPSSVSAFVAARPSLLNGTLTVTCSCRSRSALPSSIIPPTSCETTSAETGPRTSSQIRWMISPGSPSSLASSEGLVVAPERMPQEAISSTSATEPVSMKSLISRRLAGPVDAFLGSRRRPGIRLGLDPVLRPAELLSHRLRHRPHRVRGPKLPRGQQAEAGAPQEHVGDRAGLLQPRRDRRLGEQVGTAFDDRRGERWPLARQVED